MTPIDITMCQKHCGLVRFVVKTLLEDLVQNVIETTYNTETSAVYNADD
jgi:hypothetical protein